MSFKLPLTIFKEGDKYIVYSHVLDLSTSGKNFEQAQKRFLELVQIFFEELSQKGTLDEVLTNLGWTKIKSRWSPPLPVSHQLTDVSVPISN